MRETRPSLKTASRLRLSCDLQARGENSAPPFTGSGGLKGLRQILAPFTPPTTNIKMAAARPSALPATMPAACTLLT